MKTVSYTALRGNLARAPFPTSDVNMLFLKKTVFMA